MSPTTDPSSVSKNADPQGPPASGTRALRAEAGRPRITREEIEKQTSLVKDAESGKIYLEKKALIIADEPFNADTISCALLHITQLPNVTVPVRDAIRALAFILARTGKLHAADIITAKVDSVLEDNIDRIQTLLDSSLQTNTEILERAQQAARDTTDNLIKKVKEIGDFVTAASSKSTKEIKEASDSLIEASSRTATSTQLNYRDAVLSNLRLNDQDYSKQPTAGVRAQAREAIRKRQVLLDHQGQLPTQEKDPKETSSEMLDRANQIIKELFPAESTGYSFRNASRLRNGVILLELNNEEAAKWLKTPNIKSRFTAIFDPSLDVKERTYSLIAPFVPLTFDDSKEKDLRETEEVNDLPKGTIIKARWIKPQNRRTKTQTVAHLMLTMNSPESANQALLNGISICHKLIYPQKNRKEPMRCLRCHRYGHFAADCQSIHDTCGTCGHNHKTIDCDRENSRWCVTCDSTEHSSWDRFCPAFTRRCEEMDERYVENSMPYFPTNEPWTLVSAPPKQPKYRPSGSEITAPRPLGSQTIRATQTLRQTTLPFLASQREARETDLRARSPNPPHAPDRSVPHINRHAYR